ncbi:hypothetical protein LCGC14_2726940, partial [marine sediment metagenome]
METKKRPRGRPEGKNFEFIKSIKLNQKQVNNWDSKRIKAFLDGESLLKKLYIIMDTKMKPIKLLSENERNTLIKIME